MQINGAATSAVTPQSVGDTLGILVFKKAQAAQQQAGQAVQNLLEDAVQVSEGGKGEHLDVRA